MNTDVRYKNRFIKAQIPTFNGMSKIATMFMLLVIVSLMSMSSILPVNAATEGGNVGNTPATEGGNVSGGKFTLQNPLKVDSLGGLIEAFVEVFSYLVILFAVLALVYVGLRYILARGNPEEMTRLSNWLLWIMVGVAVVIGSRILVSVVINTLGNSGVVDQKVIQSANNALDGK